MSRKDSIGIFTVGTIFIKDQIKVLLKRCSIDKRRYFKYNSMQTEASDAVIKNKTGYLLKG